MVTVSICFAKQGHSISDDSFDLASVFLCENVPTFDDVTKCAAFCAAFRPHTGRLFRSLAVFGVYDERQKSPILHLKAGPV